MIDLHQLARFREPYGRRRGRSPLRRRAHRCPCGFFNDSRRGCDCSPDRIFRYLGKISGPLLDRIDLQVEVPNLSTEEIGAATVSESSVAIRERVEAARVLQQNRFTHRIKCNGDMTARELRQFCGLDAASRRLLATEIDRLSLSARACDRILKVGRTIADLEAAESISAAHISEAIQYRALDKGYFSGNEFPRAASGAEINLSIESRMDRSVFPSACL